MEDEWIKDGSRKTAMDNPAFQKTTDIGKKLRPAAIEIYKSIFKGCEYESLEKDEEDVHVLDKKFAIDAFLNIPGLTPCIITLQEKFRSNKWLAPPRPVMDGWPDITQEYKNGTKSGAMLPGEWFRLAAELYFFGWANKDEIAFERWIIFNVFQYKMIIQRLGGLGMIGKCQSNRKFGSSMFYAISAYEFIEGRLKPALCFTNFTHSNPVVSE